MTSAKSKPELEKSAFSVTEFSQRWGWGRNTTYDLINSGKLSSAKVGRRRVITAQQEADFAADLEGKQK